MTRTKTPVAVCVALMAVISSVTGLNVAQPHLAAEFGASQSAVLWIINGYVLALAALLPLGALGDRLGMGMGMGLSMPPATEAITSSLPVERQGVASALNDVTREFGTALGIALLGVMATNGSFVDGWRTAMWTGVAIMAVLFAVVLRGR
ncbi:hypothetical protein [Lentzea albidocapillata]|uniref:hypothetical protein n=1 Tax=Lentzea albidocapillata TaxID=40571 RepID=UPI001B80D8EA|nr:hypothetical protein [Lentzea albidocapillata]